MILPARDRQASTRPGPARLAKPRSDRRRGCGFFRAGLIATLLLVGGPAGMVFAGGPIHGARAAGMGTAFIGLADDPSALLHNPAGITQLPGTQLYGGITGLYLSSEFNRNGNREKTENRFFFPPHLYLTRADDSGKLAFGLALTAPFGIGGRQWDQHGQTRYLATRSQVATLALNPTLAWRATPKLSLAAGLSYLFADLLAERRLDQSRLEAADGRARIQADGDGWGFNLGLLYHGSRFWQLGLAYRSPIRVDYHGRLKLSGIAPPLQPLFAGADFSSRLRSRADFPEILSAGLAFFPSPRLTLALDLEKVNWSSFDKNEIRLNRTVPAAGIDNSTTELDWRDSWQFKIGGEYHLDGNWRLRAGFALINGVVPEAGLSPENPDADQYNFSFGCGRRSRRSTLDFFYNLGRFRNLEIENALLSGRYRSTSHLLGCSYGWKF